MKKKLLVIFKHQSKKVNRRKTTKIKLNCERLYLSKSVKYLGIKINEHFNWKQHIHDIAKNLNRANALLSIIRNYVNKRSLRTIYFAILDSHISYVNLIWGQKPRAELSSYKRKLWGLWIFSLEILIQVHYSHSRSNHILKLEDKMLIENIFFISKSFNNLLLPIFKSWFTLMFTIKILSVFSIW